MVIKISRLKPTISVNFENLVAALAVVYFLENIYFVTLHPRLEDVLWAIQFALLGCIGLLLCVQRLTVQNMLIRLLILAVFLLSFLFSGDLPLLKYSMVILAGVRCDVSKLFRKIMKAYVILVTVTLLLGIGGVLPSRIVRRGFSTYGFIHSNAAAQYVFSISCCYVILEGREFHWKQYGIFAFFIAGMWYLTDSRTTIVAMILLLLMVALTGSFSWAFRRGCLLYYIVMLTPIWLMLLNMYLGKSYDPNNPMMSKLNTMLNGRLDMANYMIQTYPVTLFGQELTTTAVENAYITGLYQFGVIPIFVEIVIYVYALRKSMLNQAYGMFVCLFTMAVHGMAESSTFNPYVNVALLTAFKQTRAKVYATLPQKKNNG